MFACTASAQLSASSTDHSQGKVTEDVLLAYQVLLDNGVSANKEKILLVKKKWPLVNHVDGNQTLGVLVRDAAQAIEAVKKENRRKNHCCNNNPCPTMSMRLTCMVLLISGCSTGNGGFEGSAQAADHVAAHQGRPAGQCFQEGEAGAGPGTQPCSRAGGGHRPAGGGGPAGPAAAAAGLC